MLFKQTPIWLDFTHRSIFLKPECSMPVNSRFSKETVENKQAPQGPVYVAGWEGKFVPGF